MAVYCAYDEIVKIEELKENPKNPNKHSEDQINLLSEVIKKTGWRASITVSTLSGLIVKGHGRLQAAIKAGFNEAPVEFQSFKDEEEEMAALLADNKIAELAEIDNEMLKEIFNEFDFEDLSLTGFSEDEFKDLTEIFGDSDITEINKIKLNDLYIASPFSILNTKTGEWQERKRFWINQGIKSELGREDDLLFTSLSASVPDYYTQKTKIENKLGRILDNKEFEEKYLDTSRVLPQTSIFDPVLCEIAYTWFSAKGDKIIDPFAGGSVRGVVASALNRSYTGLELREEQVKANIENANEICNDYMPQWVIGDSNKTLDTIENNSFDMCLSCPPYADLEVYSDNPDDLSNMDYADFIKVYQSIISKIYDKLKDNSFVVWVIGEVRRSDGNYYNFLGDTITCFINAGFNYYNEIILENVIGSAALRAGRPFKTARKVAKVHQNVLVFCKGDGKKTASRLGEIEVKDISDEDLNIEYSTLI